jgi:hypothetical protein
VSTNLTTASPRPRDTSWADLDDDALRRYSTQYRRRLALLDQEVPEDIRESTRAFLEALIEDAQREHLRREKCVALGIPREGDRFPADFLDRLRRETRLDILCEYHMGARLGRERQGKRQGPCPVCKHGSNCFTVYVADPDDQHYWCFRCGARGNCFNAMMQAWGYSFPEAVKHLADEYHIPLPVAKEEARPPARKKPAARASTRVVVSGTRRGD